MWGMGDHSRPLHAYEEAIHIPTIISHSGVISEGELYEERTCNYDFFASMAELVGVEVDLSNSPGRSYAPSLLGRDEDGRDGVIFHEFENLRMIRND